MIRKLVPIALLLSAALGVLGAHASAPTEASAQEPSRAEVAAARRLFRQGMRAGQREDWEAARQAFAQAYEIVPRPRVLLNLASAQLQTGQLVEAAESYQAFLGRVTSGPDAQYREGVEEELASLEERTPRISLDIAGLRDGDDVQVDGANISRAALNLELPLNPGLHRVQVVRGDEEISRDEFTLDEGQLHPVVLNVGTPLPSPTLGEAGMDEPGVLDPDGGSGGVLSSPWFWGGVGAAVIVTVVIIIAVAASGGSDPQSGNFGDGRLVIE